jgi:hypothetical protein
MTRPEDLDAVSSLISVPAEWIWLSKSLEERVPARRILDAVCSDRRFNHWCGTSSPISSYLVNVAVEKEHNVSDYHRAATIYVEDDLVFALSYPLGLEWLRGPWRVRFRACREMRVEATFPAES